MIELVLATDLKHHFDHLNKLRLKKTAWDTKRETLDSTSSAETWDPSDGNIFSLQTFLKLADLGTNSPAYKCSMSHFSLTMCT